MSQSDGANMRDVNNTGGVPVFGGSVGNINYNNATPHRRVCPSPPRVPDKFAGREAEIKELADRLSAAHNVEYVAIQGFGGMGKTSLAKAIANRLYRKSFRAVLWVEVNRQFDAVQQMWDWARLSDPDFQVNLSERPHDLALRVKSLLENLIAAECHECATGPTLIVLDDVWPQTLKQAELLLQAAPDPANVLITTRDSVIAQKISKKPFLIKRLGDDDGAALLANYLPDTDESLQRQMVQTLSGHALALTLTAKRLHEYPPHEWNDLLTEQLAQYRTKTNNFADLKLDNAEYKDESVEMTLAASYDDLDATLQSHFRSLGAFEPDLAFDVTLAARLWDVVDNIAKEDLRKLWQAGLIEPDENDRKAYRQHPVLNTYARALLDKDGLLTTQLNQHDEMLIKLTRQFNELQPEDWAQLDPYLPHIFVLGERLTDAYASEKLDRASLQRASDFANNIGRYIFHRPEIAVLETVRVQGWLETGRLASQLLGDLYTEAILNRYIGITHRHSNNQTQAQKSYLQALLLFRKAKNQDGEAVILNDIGICYHEAGNQIEALYYYQQALPIYRQINNKDGEAWVLHNCGSIYSNLGDKQKALKYYEEALLLFREVNNKLGEARCYANFAHVYRYLGYSNKELEYYQKALALCEKRGYKYEVASMFYNMSLVYEDLGQLEQAVEYASKAVTIGEPIKHPSLEEYHSNLVRLKKKLANETEAKEQ